jgi:hypothetical protein
MKKISYLFVFILISFAIRTNAQAFQYPSNPSPPWFIMDSSVKEAAAFSDTLVKGSYSLYLFQGIDSTGKQPSYTYHYVDGNGIPLNFIYNYERHSGTKTIVFIEVDGRKEDVMNIFNRYFHTTHEWSKEKENYNVREFVYGQKNYILKMTENKNADGDPIGTVRSAIMSMNN